MKFSMKRGISLVLALVMVLSLVPAMSIFANAATLTGLSDTSIELSGSSGKWTIGSNTLSCTISGTKIIIGYTAASETLTITNNRSGNAILSFKYLVTGAYASDRTVTIDGGTSMTSGASGTFEKELSAGGSVKVVLSSGTCKASSGQNTLGIDITEISLVSTDAGTVTTTFEAPAYGSYTVTYGTSSTTVSAGSASVAVDNGPTVAYTLTANPGTGYKLVGWYNTTTGQYISMAATVSVNFDTPYTIKAVVVPNTTAVFYVDGAYIVGLAEAISYATANGKTLISLYSSGTVPAVEGGYTIPAGMTLLIPRDDTYTPMGEEPKYSLDTTTPYAYKTLTLADGAILNVNGTIELEAEHTALQGAPAKRVHGGRPCGPYGAIYMSPNANITLNNGSKLFAWGYVYGEGTVTANSGSQVYEYMQVTDFPGGDNLSNFVDSSQSSDADGDGIATNDYVKSFPFSQYYVQNIEVEMTLHYGASEKIYATMYASSMDISTEINFIGNGGMFVPSSGYITKDYDPSTDRLIICAYGDSTVKGMVLDMSGHKYASAMKVLFGASKFDAANYILMLNGNISIKAMSGTTTIQQDVTLLPGLEIYVDSNATLVIDQKDLGDSGFDDLAVYGSGGYSIYAFDAENWGNFVFSSQKLIAASYSPTAGRYKRTTSDLKDVVIDINGTVICDGFVYSTVTCDDDLIPVSGGASVISSKKTGQIIMNNGAGWEEFAFCLDGTSSADSTVNVASVWLKNGDGTFLETAGAEPGATFGYCAEHDCWYSEACPDCDTHEHSYNEVVTAPTCTAAGYTTYTCSGCGDTYTDNAVAATGHSWNDATCETAKTCSVCGATEGDALGHSYNAVVTDPTCTEDGYTTYTCASCGDTYTGNAVAATGHSWNDATCETSKTCSVCGATEGDALGHSYNAVVTAPTCTEDGYTTYTCATCGDSYVDDAVAAAGHSWNDATCETAKTCSVCGATEGDALGHSWADTTCQAPRTCSICGATEGSALGHNYVNGFCTDCDAYQPAVLNGDFYEISNGGQLYWFADQVNGGNNAINGKLMNDIVVNENVLNESGYLNNGNFRIWVAIGYYESDTDKVEYTGTFDGNGKTVAGLYNEWGTRSYYGLFSIVGSQGAVKNFGVVASYLSGGSYFGCVVGYNYGTVTNCYNAGHIKPYGNYIGGVVGYNAGTVDGCYNLADVSGYGGDYHLGGVVGSNTGLLINCYNTGCVTGDSYRNVGGVVGFSSGTVSGCYNTGSVSANYHTGGIVGLSEHEIIDCYNSGTVSGDTYTGGIAGENYFGIITECYNTGDVFGNDDAGGIVGYNNGYVSKCYNTGNISFRGQYPSSHGGIAGTSNYTGAHISYCYSSGNVSGNSFVGGVVGSAGSTTVTHCYATGNISGSGYSVGGITGSGSPSNCYATGSVSGSDGVGGITGSGSPSNCYYLIGNAVDEDGTVQFGVGIYITGYTRADVAGCTTGMTAEQFASGEACYLLQSDRSTQIWGQLIGTDAYPVFSDDKVYKAGERYTNSLQDACEHQVTYSFSGTTHTVSCSLCGKTVTLSGTDEFKINSAYLTLASDVSVIFRATIPAGFENAYMVFNVNGVEYTAYSMGRDDQGRDLFSYPGINPQMMGDNINAVLYATVDGMEVTPAKTVNYSVLTYCNKQLPTAGKNFKTLISDLLTYGAASQIKLGYKTDALVTDLATTALTPSTFPGASAITNQQAAIGDKNSVADVTGVGLNLSNQVVCKFGFTITDTDLSKYTIKIVIGSKETLINASECYSENGKYWINYCDYSASQFDETITVTLWDGSTQMGRTFTYSVNSYFAKNANSSDAGLAGLVQAVYNYGASAAAYVANPNG